MTHVSGELCAEMKIETDDNMRNKFTEASSALFFKFDV
jgi:hypothetical protein